MTRPTLLAASHTLRHRSGQARERLETVPGSLLGVSWPLLASPGRPKIALGSALARPSRVPNAPRRVPETALDAQHRPGAIFRRFFVDLAQFFGDFRPTFGRSNSKTQKVNAQVLRPSIVGLLELARTTFTTNPQLSSNALTVRKATST